MTMIPARPIASLFAVGLLLIAASCAQQPILGYDSEPTTNRYSPPQTSRLIAVRPYPNPDDVCQVIGENSATAELLDHTATLIGCPKHERGAIGDRMRDGGVVVGHARHWTLLSMPN